MIQIDIAHWSVKKSRWCIERRVPDINNRVQHTRRSLKELLGTDSITPDGFDSVIDAPDHIIIRATGNMAFETVDLGIVSYITKDKPLVARIPVVLPVNDGIKDNSQFALRFSFK